MNNNNEYTKLTEVIHVEGTSYGIKIGFSIKSNMWNIYLLKDGHIVNQNTFSSEMEHFPDQNILVNWVTNAIPIPLISPRKVMDAIIKAKAQVDANKSTLIPQEETLVDIEQKIKTQEVRFKQNAELLQMLKQINQLIKDGATGLDIQKEFAKHPLIYTGLFRIYDSMFKRVGNNKLSDLTDTTLMINDEKIRVDSPVYFIDLINYQLNHALTENKNIENNLEKLRKLKGTST